MSKFLGCFYNINGLNYVTTSFDSSKYTLEGIDSDRTLTLSALEMAALDATQKADLQGVILAEQQLSLTYEGCSYYSCGVTYTYSNYCPTRNKHCLIVAEDTVGSCTDYIPKNIYLNPQAMAQLHADSRIPTIPYAVTLTGNFPPKAARHNSDKNRVELIDPRFIEGIGRVLTLGAKKYADDNWREGLSWRECCGSTLRHLYAFMRGERDDPESGESHLLHVASNAMFLYIHVLDKLGTNDLPTTKE